jgi:hypothetical protein
MIVIGAIVLTFDKIKSMAIVFMTWVLSWFRKVPEDAVIVEIAKIEQQLEDKNEDEKLDTLISQGIFESVKEVMFSETNLTFQMIEKRIGSFSSAYNNSERAFISLAEKTKSIVNAIYKYQTGSDYFEDLKSQARARAIIDRLEKISETVFNITTADSMEFIALYRELQSVRFALAKTPLSAIILQVLSKFRASFDQINSRLNHNTRKRPLGIFLTGKPGCGKTTCVPTIISTIHAMAMQDNFTTKECSTYERKSGNEFWDQYRGQFATTIDDIYQLIDVQLRAVTSLDLIDMINTNPYPLHSASIEEKGNLFFDSELVVMTANYKGKPVQYLPVDLQVNDPNAIYRRMDCKFLVSKKNEDKVCDGDDILSNMEFTELFFKNGEWKPVGNALTLYEFIAVAYLRFKHVQVSKAPNVTVPSTVIRKIMQQQKEAKDRYKSHFNWADELESQMDGGDDDDNDDTIQFDTRETDYSEKEKNNRR